MFSEKERKRQKKTRNCKKMGHIIIGKNTKEKFTEPG